MGTNFYWYGQPKNLCTHCGRSDGPPELHIGKSSVGWVFAVRVHPEKGINSLDDWKAHWAATEGHIENEYGERLTVDEMLAWITDRGRDGYEWTSEELAQAAMNHAQRGPRGLWRSQPRHPHLSTGTVREAEDGGTYEYCDYEFS